MATPLGDDAGSGAAGGGVDCPNVQDNIIVVSPIMANNVRVLVIGSYPLAAQPDKKADV